MFAVIIAYDKPGFAKVRADTKLSHRTHLDGASGAVRVLQSGPLLSQGGQEEGSLIVVEARSLDDVHAFVEADPYLHAGLFRSVAIRQWAWTRGNPYLKNA